MANFENDYIMRMIRDMVRFVATLTFGRTDLMVELPESGKAETATLPPSALLYADMMALVEQGEINSAEDMLYERLDIADDGCLEAGLAFYHYLTELGDDALEECDYSREEILDGLHELCGMYGIAGLEQFA